MTASHDHCKIPLVVVVFLGIIGIVLSGGLLVLAYHEKQIDGGLSTLAGTAIGALGAILTNTRQSQRQTDEPVPVTNVPGEAIETKEVNSEVEH